MSDIKASEILGTVRAGLKLYQAFEHLSKVVAFLEQQEAYEQKLVVSNRNLEIQKADLQEDIEAMTLKLNQLNGKAEEAQSLLASTIATQAQTRSSIVEAAEKEAAEIVGKAKAEVAGMADRKSQLQTDIKSMDNEILRKKSELEVLNEQIERTKADAIRKIQGG